MTNLDWSLIQTFLAVAETGTLSNAARILGMTQPTAGRHIQQIEQELGIVLFARKARGLALTEAGADLITHAQAMREAVSNFELTAAGRSEALSGAVRITASVFTAHHILPAIIARFRQREPSIQIDLVATDSSDNLLFREADIAVRMYRSQQLDIITQHIGDIALGLYASRDYIARRGEPASVYDLQNHEMVGYDRSDLILRGMRAIGIDAKREMFATRCDQHAVYWELIRAGCGIGPAQRHVAERYPDVVEVCKGTDLPTLPLWLAAHETMRQTPRIRRVWDMLYDGLKPVVS